ncbi:hypothetical protein [Sphingomonas sp. RS2018]
MTGNGLAAAPDGDRIVDPPSTSDRRSLATTVLVGWGVAAIVLTLVSIPQIVRLHFPDPDDALRLVEVRDWLAGQGWWDVSQHRLWFGAFQMHWSRLVDLPLAASLIVLQPLGAAWATRLTMTIVPLVTLLVVMALGAELTRRMSDVDRARMAVLLAPLSVPLVYQLRPMRIDHHGWQVALAMAGAVALMGRPDRRSGALCGLALAALVTVSLEGLPIAAAILGVMALAAAVDTRRRDQALAALWTLSAGVVVLQIATRGPNMMAPACDAIAPVWIAAMATSTILASLALAVRTRSIALRLVLLAAAGGAALAVVYVLAPQCTQGPFATLDPLVYGLWYRNVSEGLPVWDQFLPWALATISFPIIGLVGATMAWRSSAGEARFRWAMILGLSAAAFALSLLVMRMGATANALALPGGAWLLHAMLGRARAVVSTPKRTVATAAALVAVTPGLMGGMLLGAPLGGGVTRQVAMTGRVIASCDPRENVSDLAALPAATLFAPLDIGPAILALTGHRAIGSGYHRNAGSIHVVLATFLAPPDRAKAVVLASGATYVVGCPGMNETEIYKSVAANGLWARLERGDRFAWLQPVQIAHSPMLVWRVIR